MALNLTGGVTGYALMIDNFAKTISREAVTQTQDNMTGSEELSWGTAGNITGAFFRKGENWQMEKQGLFENADAILLVKPAVTINKNDKITYDSASYIIDTIVTRSMNGNVFYKTASLFLY